jgi:hypothetical protein
LLVRRLTEADADDRPNIVFILTDDLDARLLEDNAASFPAFHRLLANEGTSFADYFVSDSLCCPSRATTLRGQYDHNTGIPGNLPGLTQPPVPSFNEADLSDKPPYLWFRPPFGPSHTSPSSTSPLALACSRCWRSTT